MTRVSIPSPPWSQYSLGPLTVHAYALCILLGILVAIALGNRRWVARGGRKEEVEAIGARRLGVRGAVASSCCASTTPITCSACA